jgi:Dual specificity phosphatase, catalytic domain
MSKYQVIEEPQTLFNEILPNLFMGGTLDLKTIDCAQPLQEFQSEREFDCIVTLYAWAAPANWGVEERRLGFPDAQIIEEYLEPIHEMAAWAHSRWKSGKKVLIRCQAGLNRSGLLTALVLLQEGHSPKQAIELIREKRSEWALCNSDYVAYIESLGGK